MNYISVQGSYHQGDIPLHDDFVGSQCTAISFFAGIMSKIILIGEWNHSSIDLILFHGHSLFKTICECTHNGIPVHLLHSELPSEGEIVSDYAEISFTAQTLFQSSCFGLIGYDCSNGMGLSLYSAFVNIFSESDFCLLTVSDVTVAVFARDIYYVFDPHSTNRSGVKSSDGYATLLHFASLQTMCNYFRSTNEALPGSQFEITSVCLDASGEMYQTPIALTALMWSSSCNCTLAFVISQQAVHDHTNSEIEDSCKHRAADVDFAAHENQSGHAKVVLDLLPTESSLEWLEQDNQYQQSSVDHIIESVMQSGNHLSSCVRNLNTLYTDEHIIHDLHISALVETIVAANLVRPTTSGKLPKNMLPQRSCFKRFCQLSPRFSCHCCLRILYDDQVVFCCVTNNITKSVGLQLGSLVCRLCLSALKDCKLPNACFVNNLYVEKRVSELSELNIVERRFITKLQTYMSLILLPHGNQYGQRGMAIHFPCNVITNVQVLPICENYAPIVFASGSRSISIVRPSPIYKALNYLKEHNPLYADIVIDKQRFHESDLSRHEYLHTDLDEFGTINMDYDVPNISAYNLVRQGSFYSFPRSTSAPIDFNTFQNAEPLAFPWLFPGGRFHRDTVRPKLSLLRYYWSRLYNRDCRFRHDVSYILASCNSFEKVSLFSYLAIRMRILKISKTNENFVPVTASDINTCTENSDILQNSYMFLRKIRGTCAYWKDKLWDLLSIIRSIGPPDVFVTLSCDDQWSDLKRAISVDCGNVTNVCEAVRKNPLIVAWHFERRWTCFLNTFLLSKNGPLGAVQDHWARIEFQNRGSPHVHAFFWLQNCPGIHKGSSSEEICKFIDSIISTQVPDSSSDSMLHHTVTVKQTHGHSTSCRVKGKCRFLFPRRTCQRTALILNADMSNAKSRFRFYEPKRELGAEMINDYNPSILREWDANTDCQVIGGYLGAAFYVCSYICKSEPSELRQKLAEIICGFTEPATLTKRSRLLQIGMAVLKMRRLSAIEACFRLGNLKLSFSSREVVRVTLGLPQNRMKILKANKDRKKLDSSSLDVFHNSILDYYRDRPKSYHSMSLCTFASGYRVVNRTTCLNDRTMTLQATGAFAVKRTKLACLRTTVFKEYNEEYYYSLLLLHLPHFSESDLLNPFSTAEEALRNKFTQIDCQKIVVESTYNELLRCMERLCVCSVTSCSYVEPMENYETIDNYETYESPELDDIEQSQTNRASVRVPSSMQRSSLDRLVESSAQEVLWHRINVGALDIENRINSLSNDQLRVFKYIQYAKSRKESFYIYITGDAGTGKSYLCRFLIDWLSVIDAKLANWSPVLVCAPTGLAARNINGQTIHSALKINVQRGYEAYTNTISPKILSVLRQKLTGVKTLFIDEISMVSANLLQQVHERLSAVTGSNNIFGGLNVIVAGDFFQLRPVRGKFAFTNPFLWEVFEPFYLTENIRQSGDAEFCDILSRAKTGSLTNDDATILMSRIVTEPAINPEVLRLFPTRKQVVSFNTDLQTKLPSATVKIECSTIFSDLDLNPFESISSDLIPDDDRVAGGLYRELQLSHGTRVMLLKNISLDEGLINGAMGFVVDFHYETNESRPVAIVVRFDDPAVGRLFMHSNLGSHSPIRIEEMDCDYIYKGRHFIRRQFPLCPAWGVTIHKSQGLSLKTVCASLGNEVFCAGQAYVALSRVTTLAGLHLEKIDFDKVYCDLSDPMSFLKLSELLKTNTATFTTKHIRATVINVVRIQNSELACVASLADDTDVLDAEVRIACPGADRIQAGNVVILMNAYWSPKRQMLCINRRTIVGKYVCGVEIPEAVREKASTVEGLQLVINGSAMNISAAKSENANKYFLKGKVVQKGKLIEFSSKIVAPKEGEPKDCVCNLYLKDNTGRTRVALFREKAGTEVVVGQYMTISALTKRQFKQETTFASTELTCVERMDWSGTEVSSEEEEDIDGDAIMATGMTIVGYSSISVYSACNVPRCNRKKLVESTDNISGATDLV